MEQPPCITNPEILAPAGSPECLPAAVAGGATAVYLGLRHFNARGRAENFRKADLPDHVAYLHQHGLKCYVVLNTLVHEDEQVKALDLAAAAVHAGVDAAIVQDLGLMSLLRQYLPQLAVHASTQMTIHHPSQIEALAQLGASRVILARELSLPELRTASICAHRHGMDIEHFVHGALCYALSGQCLMSNFAGCRSANRGTCAQNCRFVYHDESDPAQEPDTVISMRDLSLIERVGELLSAGVASFKIEGRLKGPDYVYTVSKAYADAVAAWQAGRPVAAGSHGDALRTVFARSFTSTPLDADYGAAARLGLASEGDEVVDAEVVHCYRARGEAVLRSARAPLPGQGYTFQLGSWRGGLQIISVARAGGDWRCRIRIEARGPALPAGTALRLNSDPERLAAARRAMAAVPAARAQAAGLPLHAQLTVSCGQRPQLSFYHDQRLLASVQADHEALAANKRPLAEAEARAALGTLADSGYVVETFDLVSDGKAFVPQGQLKALRRAVVAALPPAPGPPSLTFRPPPEAPPLRRRTQLWVAVGSLAAAAAARDAGAEQCWLDDPCLDWWAGTAPSLALSDDLRSYLWLRHPAAAALSQPLIDCGLPVVAGHVGVLVAAQRAGLAAIADHYCNVYSTATMAVLARLGAQATVLSLECSAREVARLVSRLHDPQLPQVAVVVHGRVPAMLTRQDHALAVGAQRRIRASQREGGLPYEIQRHSGAWTAIWEARRLAAPEEAALTSGLVDGWVLELADLEPAAVAAVVAAYRALADGTGDAQQVLAAAAPHAAEGFFPGHLAIGSRALDLPTSEQSA